MQHNNTSDEENSSNTSNETENDSDDSIEETTGNTKPRTYAASSATEAEQRLAKLGQQPDGSKPVEVPKRIWRPKVKFTYEEPEDLLDTSEGLDWMFEDKGHVIAEPKRSLPQRTDIIIYNPAKHQKEIDQNVQWRDCPEVCRPIIRSIIERFFDVFAQEGMQRSIRGFEFHIDTGTVKPITCKVPVYGAHEERVIQKLVKTLEKKGLIEDDDGPWGSPIVLASKPNQGHVHWSQYVFRLCVSYRALNAITRPFLFPVRRCDDAIEQIGAARHVITMDLDAGYWQMKLRESSRAKTAFYTPRGKKRWRVTPMGATNAHPAFVAMAMRMEDEWGEEYRKRRRQTTEATTQWLKEIITNTLAHMNSNVEETAAWETDSGTPWERTEEPEPKSAVIVDDILIAAENMATLLFYFTCVLTILQFYRVTVKLRKTRFFPKRAEFVGADVLTEGNSPAEAKNETITKLTRPILFTDLRMLIGFIGFYRNWIPLYETRITPWRRILKRAPSPGSCDKEEEAKLMTTLWETDDRTEEEKFKEYGETNDRLLESLKQEVLSGPILKRPDSNRRFYVKSDWSAWAQGAVLLQADTSEETEAAMWREIHGGQCEFDKAIEGLRLRPIQFISLARQEKSTRHSFVGEASTGRWAFLKFKRHLIGREFTWITDCSGIKKFFETDYEATHTQQRWKLELLRFDFTIVHRPGRMLTECDMLSRYNTWTREWRNKSDPASDPPEIEEQTKTGLTLLTEHINQLPRPIAFTISNPQITGPTTNNTTRLAKVYDRDRPIWIVNAGANTVEEAITNLGFNTTIAYKTDEDKLWQEREDAPNMQRLIDRMKRNQRNDLRGARWMAVQADPKWTQQQQQSLMEMIKTAHTMGTTATIITYTNRTEDELTLALAKMEALANTLNLTLYSDTIQNTRAGGPIEATTVYFVLAPEQITATWKQCSDMNDEEAAQMEDILDVNDGIFEDCNRYQQQGTNEPTTDNTDRYKARAKGTISITPYDIDNDTHNGEEHTVYDITHPAPMLTTHEDIMIEATNGVTNLKSRPMRRHEILSALGHQMRQHEWTGHEKWRDTHSRLKHTTPRHTWERLFAALDSIEADHAEVTIPEETETQTRTMVARVINRWTTLPEPTTEDWRNATHLDHDLTRIKTALETNQPLMKAGLHNKRYFKEWNENKLELQDGIIYQYEEPKATKIRQLRRRVVPERLKETIITAYHATPLAGHTGYYKTYWRIAARFFWPGMSKDIRKAVLECGHCQVANTTSHAAQQILDKLETGEPFDVISIDIWYPGKTMTDNKRIEGDRHQKAIMTSSCTMTGFVSLAFILTLEAEVAARLVFSHFFIPNGLPKLVVIDAGGEFKGMLITMCEILGIKYYAASPESHNAVSVERFHRYLNKVQRIHQADTQSYEQWKMAALFAAYAWNASPIDGLDVIRSFAAKARTFRFPLDTSIDDGEERIPMEGEEALQHLETMFPLWYRQKTLLKVLNDERRRRHREMMNDGRTKRTFQPHDIVIIRKQLKSKEGQPAKLSTRAKGTYRIIEPAGENSYNVQKIPAIQSRTRRPGKIQKEAAMRLTKLPSTIVVHKRVDTADTRFVERDAELVHNPLEKSLGLFDFGKYARAAPGEDFAFVKIAEMWDETIHSADEGFETDDTSNSEGTNDEDLRIEQNTKQETKRKRKRQNEEADKRPATRQQRDQQEVEKRDLKRLHESIQRSEDKLFIIKRKEPNAEMANWHVVQISWDETNHTRARRQGEYYVRYYVRNATDAKKRLVCNCRYWPLIYEILANGYFGQMIMIKPGKVEEILRNKPNTRGWYETEMNIAEDGLIGPFNFTTAQNGNTTETHRIEETIWKALEEEVREEELDVDISDLRTKQPF